MEKEIPFPCIQLGEKVQIHLKEIVFCGFFHPLQVQHTNKEIVSGNSKNNNVENGGAHKK